MLSHMWCWVVVAVVCQRPCILHSAEHSVMLTPLIVTDIRIGHSPPYPVRPMGVVERWSRQCMHTHVVLVCGSGLS